MNIRYSLDIGEGVRNMAAYYLQINDAYDIWDSLPEYTWQGLYQALDSFRGGGSHLDENLLVSLEYLLRNYQYSNERFPTTPRELFDFFSTQVPQYVSY